MAAEGIPVEIEGVGKVYFPKDYTPERIKFAIENDILPRVAKESQPAAVTAGNTLREIPRQVGLAARYGAEGLADTAGIFTEPIRMAVNPVLKAVGLPTAPSTRGMVSGALDALGVPSPQGANERVVGDVTRLMAGGGGLAKGAQMASKAVTGPVAKAVTTALGENVGSQTAAAAGSGAAGGAVREAGGGPLEQFGAAVAGGLGGTGLLGAAKAAYNGISDAVGTLLRPKQSIMQVNVTLNEILSKNGVDVASIPPMVRAELASEVKKALDTGRELNPDAVRRIADYGIVGATPTRGTVTLDPVQITREKNLAKVGANSSDPKLQELARVQNANNSVFIDNLNDLGAARSDSMAAGAAATGAVKARDAAAKASEKALYDRARDSQGRALDLDREGFIYDAYRRLGESNKSAFLPAEIKSLLEQIRAGTVKVAEGQEVPVPFNVDVIDNLKTTLSAASRASKDGNTRAAIAKVRDALENTQPRAVGRQVGGSQVVDPAALSAAQGQADDSATAAMKAFDEARRFARARRNWQESAPGIAAALDDAAPDRFVKDFILSNGNRAATADVEKLLFTIRKDPGAAQAVKENVVGYLKSKALSGASDEVGNFSQSSYNKALSEIGDAKLKLFFSPDEISKLKALGRVSSYEMVQPKGSAVNNSNTASGLAGLLESIAGSRIIGRIPFGDAAVRQPAQNWATQIGTKQAMDVGGTVSNAKPSPEMMRLEQLFGPGLLLAAPRTEGREDQKRK